MTEQVAAAKTSPCENASTVTAPEEIEDRRSTVAAVLGRSRTVVPPASRGVTCGVGVRGCWEGRFTVGGAKFVWQR